MVAVCLFLVILFGRILWIYADEYAERHNTLWWRKL